MMLMGKFYIFKEKILQASKAHKQIKIKTVLNAHKNVLGEENCLFGIKSMKSTWANKKYSLSASIKSIKKT